MMDFDKEPTASVTNLGAAPAYNPDTIVAAFYPKQTGFTLVHLADGDTAKTEDFSARENVLFPLGFETRWGRFDLNVRLVQSFRETADEATTRAVLKDGREVDLPIGPLAVMKYMDDREIFYSVDGPHRRKNIIPFVDEYAHVPERIPERSAAARRTRLSVVADNTPKPQ